MFGLSLREYIELKYGLQIPSVSLETILHDHTQLAFNIIEQLDTRELKILRLFQDYLKNGYYPYFQQFEAIEEFYMTLEQNLHTTLESDLVAIYPHLSGNSIKKIKQLVSYLAQAVPVTPNWQTIRNITEIGDDRTIKTYFKYLEDAHIICSLGAATDKMKRLEHPEKVFLANPNQLYAFATRHPNQGTLRETFFLSNIRPKHHVTSAKNTDFLVDDKHYFEIGGKNKRSDQIKGQANACLALDDIEHGTANRIPLWLLGFLY